MNPLKQTARLTLQCVQLWRRGDLVGAIALQQEILTLMWENGGSDRQMAVVHKQMSLLYLKNKNLPLAEIHAQRALALHPIPDRPPVEVFEASLGMDQARILALAGRQAEAVLRVEVILDVLNRGNFSPDMLWLISDELAAMRAGTWKNSFCLTRELFSIR